MAPPIKMKLAIFATHPIQNQVPAWRELAKIPDVDVKVVYASDFSVKGYRDKQFGVDVKWDQPMLDGYESVVLGHAQRRGYFSLDGRGIVNALADFQPDCGLVCAYEPKFYPDAILYLKAQKAGVLMRADLTDEDRTRTWYLKLLRDFYAKWIYSKIDRFCIIGKISIPHLLRFGIGEERIVKAGYNVDDALFVAQRERFEPQREVLRKEMGIPRDGFVFLMPAKLIDKKRPDLLLEAYLNLPEALRLKIHIIFMGDGALKPSLQRRLEGEAIQHVHFSGFVNQAELGSYYTICDAVVLPSAYAETWGLVINEAMIFGRPCLVSDRVGSRHDLVIEGKTGMIFPSGDQASLEEKIARMVTWIEQDRSIITKECLKLGDEYTAFNAAAGIAQAMRNTLAERHG